jgi:GSH-dependent disulfide-bond oxidoreductase
MIDVYSWPTPNGHKIHIMLEETGLKYRVHGINIREGDQFRPEFLKISSNNRIPAIVDHDGPGGKPLSLFESGAILLYLASKSGKFLPQDLHARWTCVQWLMWQMGGVGPMFGQATHFRSYSREKLGYPVERYTKEANRLTRVLDKRLGYRDLPLDAGRGTAGRQTGGVCQRQALVRRNRRPARGAAGRESAGRSAERSRRAA